MAGKSNVVERAESLMRRRRSFVAMPASVPVPDIAPHPTSEDDDIPTLTDVIFDEPAAGTPPDAYDEEAQLTLLASEIASAVGQQLAYEMPTLLEAVLLNVGEELRNGITVTIESALRDFIAKRKQLSLPLE